MIGIALRNVVLFMTVLFLAGVILPQQIIPDLQVKVVDPNGDLIPEYHVRLKKDGKVIKGTVSEDPPEITFSELAAGKYVLEVKASRFKPKLLEIDITSGKKQVTIMLEIAETVENVEVGVDEREAATENAFSNILTPREIAELPDDPDEMRRVLKERAGGGDVVIRVDGFAGADLPAKSRIASIRIVRSSYDAENHRLGVIYVDIVTKVGSRRFSGALSFNFNDEALNARNPFSGRRFPEQNRDTFFFLSGPIVENKTAFSLLFSDRRNFQAQNIVAFLPDGAINDSVNSQTAGKTLNLSINHNLTKDIPVKLVYRFSDNDAKNLGIGGFRLPDRAFDLKRRSHELRFSSTVYFAKRFLNEFRVQYKKEDSSTTPQSEDISINVLDSFSSGGAGNFQESSKQSIRVANNLLFGIRQHAIKIGGDVFIENQERVSANNQNGTFTFSTLQDFVARNPSIFTQSQSIRNAGVTQYQIGAFVQDDIRVRKDFITSFGVRYELQNNLRDHNNFSPRAAFSWTPFKNSFTTFRGGVGLFYNWLEVRDLLTVDSRNLTQPGETIIFNPEFSNPFLSGVSSVLPPSFTQKAEDLRNPYIFHTSFGVRHRVSRNMSVRAEYVYQKGIHQFRSRDVNAPFEGVRPNLVSGKVVQVESSAFFVRSALNAGVRGNFTKNISYSVNYTLSKNISDSNGVFGLPSDNLNLRSDRSAANLDQRHRFNGYVGWQIRRGLHLGAAYLANSPLPFTITTGRDNNLDTTFNDRPFGIGRNSERGRWRNQVNLDLSYIFSFVNRKGKSNKGISIVTRRGEGAPGITDPTKRFSLRFFMRTLNVLNQTNLKNFAGVQTSPFFGQATSADQARKMTFGVRFNF